MDQANQGPLDPREGPHGTTKPMKAVVEDEMTTYRYPEAFRIMTYASPDRSVIRQVWNSRDGFCPDRFEDRGVVLQHVDPECDLFAPLHVPDVGDWIWVDWTQEDENGTILATFDHLWRNDRPRLYKALEVPETEGFMEKEQARALFLETMRKAVPADSAAICKISAQTQQKFYEHRSQNHPLLKSVMAQVGPKEDLVKEFENLLASGDEVGAKEILGESDREDPGP